MCGRYQITSAPEAIRALFRYPERPNFPARYNVAPTQPVPIVRVLEGERHFALVRWGLIPPWVQNPAEFTLLINARGESVNEKPAFKNAMKRRRCLFPADGFYEWKADGRGKRAYHLHPAAGGPIAFAGLWETWMGPNGEEMETAAIVTTLANAEMGAVHSRAPVILQPPQFEMWLDCRGVDEAAAAALIQPAPNGSMIVDEVSSAVNKFDNDGPALIVPVEPGAEIAQPAKRRSARALADSKQGSLF